MYRTTTFKLILVGDSGVGKSSLVQCFHNQRRKLSASKTYTDGPTIGAAFSIETILVNNVEQRLQIWDTAGQERFKAVARIYYRDSIGCFCVFDLADHESFVNLKKWIADYYEINNKQDSVIMIVANKSDRPKADWKVTEEEIQELADKNKCTYIYTSSVSEDNVYQMFEQLVRLIKKLDTQVFVVPKEEMIIIDKPSVVIDLVNRIQSVNHCSC